jgi:hypothetical protein
LHFDANRHARIWGTARGVQAERSDLADQRRGVVCDPWIRSRSITFASNQPAAANWPMRHDGRTLTFAMRV